MQNLGDRLLNALLDVLKFMWHFSVTELSTLFHQPWYAMPIWKSVVVLGVILIAAVLLWSYIVEFGLRLWMLLVSSVYALAGLFIVGLVAFATNWFIHYVQLPGLDRYFASN